MKELSIKDKAKRYDEAISKMKEIITMDNATTSSIEIGEYVFPELKSEDEKIRKELITHFKNTRCVTKEGAEKILKWITWLEKQDSNNEYVFRPVAGTMIENAVKQALKQGDVVLAFNGFYTPVKGKTSDEILAEYDCWIDKQSKNKSNFSDLRIWKYIVDMVLTEKDGIGNYLDNPDTERIAKKLQEKYGNIEKQSEKPQGKSALEAVKEEKVDDQNCVKPADKVEPKFHEGDTMRTWREAANGYTDGMPVVVSIDNEYYHCTNELIAIKDQDNYEFPPINMKQKSSDKVESKFHVGNWYQCIKDFFGKGVTFDKNTAYYCAQEGCLQNEYGCHIAIVKDLYDNFKLWEIADAKEGDILSINWHEGDDSWEKIIIFKKYHNKGVKGLYSMPCVEGYGNTFKNGKLAFQEEVPYYSKTWTANLHPATKEQHHLLFTKMKEKGYEYDNKKKELKKVKPKFHNGDWVVNEVTGLAYQIKNCSESLNNHEYGYDLTNGGYIGSDDVNIYHLWSIDDAKHGDALVDAYGNIGIFDKCYDFDWMSSCSLVNNGGFQYFTVKHKNEKTHPATKEQRELLFQKMKEAGWEWDNEKKELNKFEPKFNVGEWIVTEDSFGKIVRRVEEIRCSSDDTTLFNMIDKGYVVSDENGLFYDISFDSEHKWHKWTISDARDGDVVADKSDGTIGIFQSIGHHSDGGSCNDHSYCFLHCRYDDSFFYADFEILIMFYLYLVKIF